MSKADYVNKGLKYLIAAFNAARMSKDEMEKRLDIIVEKIKPESKEKTRIWAEEREPRTVKRKPYESFGKAKGKLSPVRRYRGSSRRPFSEVFNPEELPSDSCQVQSNSLDSAHDLPANCIIPATMVIAPECR